MARPKIPLISRRKALQAALKIMDTEGLDSLSIRRLADELGVNGASLYHHFANKEEIVVGATEIALAGVRTPTETDEDWRTWLPRNSRMLRKAMLEHPELVPIIVRKGELGMGMQMMDSSARLLMEEGVPIGAVAPLLDALEMFAIGSAIHETRGADEGYTTERGEESLFTKAARSSSLSADELYEVVSTAIVTAVERAAATAKASSRRAPARKAAVKAVPRAAATPATKPSTKSASRAAAKPVAAAAKPVVAAATRTATKSATKPTTKARGSRTATKSA